MNICHLSLSPVLNDIRILRQVNCLRDAGHDVTLIGYGAGVDERPMTKLERIRRAAWQMPSWVLPEAPATSIASQIPALRQMWEAVRGRKFDIIHAHDAEALLVAERLARQCGGKLIYDSHEFGQEARKESLAWRIAFPAFIRAIENKCLPRVDAVITVSDFLANLLQQNYGLVETPTVIRNVPRYEAVQRRETKSERIWLHYHGILNSGRGIEIVLHALKLLPQHFYLRVMGPVRQPGYDKMLADLTGKLDLAHRVEIKKAVPADQLIHHASQADIGIFVTQGQSRHELAALPNKVFEYAMAGLAVVGGPSPDVCRFISENDIGIPLVFPSPEILAEKLRPVSQMILGKWQDNALDAAKSNNWDLEKQKLLSVYDHIG